MLSRRSEQWKNVSVQDPNQGRSSPERSESHELGVEFLHVPRLCLDNHSDTVALTILVTYDRFSTRERPREQEFTTNELVGRTAYRLLDNSLRISEP